MIDKYREFRGTQRCLRRARLQANNRKRNRSPTSTLFRSATPTSRRTLRSKLKTSYVLGYILLKRGDLPEGGARTAAYTTYTAIWRKFVSLSMVVLEGRLVRKDQSDAPCPQCANVPISVTVRNGAEMAACRVKQTDSNGRFLARLVTRSADVSAEFSATVGTVKSERITVGKAQLNPPDDGSSFLRRFSFNLPIDIKGQAADWLASLELLRALHAQAAVQNTIATDSCAAAQTAIAEIASSSARP